MKTIIFIIFMTVQFASDQIPGATQSQSILLKGGTIHTVSGEDLIGDILLDGGKIVAIGEDLKSNDSVIDVSGKHIYPGFIAASTTLGLVEVNAVRSTRDYKETGSFNPNVRAERAYNPDSELIPITRSNGVLLAHVTPQGGRISGTSALMQLDGWTWEDCILETPTGIHINWPKMDVYKSRWDDTPEEEIQKNIKKHLAEIERYMDDAYAYSLAKAEGKNAGIDLRWEGMIPLLKKEIPAFIHAQRFAQIDAAINFSLRYDLRIVIVGGADAEMLTHRLVEYEIPVIYEHPLTTPLRRWEPYNSKYTVPRNLYEAGVKYCISYSSSTFQAPHQRSLPYAAAMAVSFGLPLKEGLRAITLSAAEILGVGDRVGSLEVGKDATLFITNGDPLQMDSQVELAFIQGRVVDLNDRHKTLSDKYREKYRQLNIIK